MGGRRDYTRWDYDDETEITMEEQLTLEENSSLGGGGGGTDSNATFPPPNVMSSSSPIRSREMAKRSRKMSIKEKAQLLVLSGGVLLVGFIVGFAIGTRDRGTSPTFRHSKHSSSSSDLSTGSSSLHEHNELMFHELVSQITADNIRHNLKRMSQEEHRTGTAEGRSMAMAIRDLWRSYGISVRVEQHKTLLTKTEKFNFVEVLDKNGSVLFTTSKIDDVNLPNSRPIVAFSSSADFNGTLVYAHYGQMEDFQRLRKSQSILNGSIALIRFGSLHISNVANNAMAFGIRGMIFYPDPVDFGPLLPSIAVRRASLLTVGQVHDFQKHKGNWSIPCHTISSKDAEKLFGAMDGTEKAPVEWQGGLKTSYFLGGRKPDGGGLVHLKIFNEAKTSSIYNVVAAIPGVMESDRYVIVGCSHDSWAGSGAGDPGVGLAMATEILRAFSSSLATGWKPRRSILFVSWDANLFASSGVSHWLQEHHFEIATRAIAYIDLTRMLQGNQTLEVFSSPLLKEVARKAINRLKRSTDSFEPTENSNPMKQMGFPNIQWKSAVSSDEPAFAFLGNLGIPFIRLCVSNAPGGYNYPLYHTTFDTFDNFAKLVDSEFKGSEALGKIIAEITLLLADSSALPITLHDYIKEIRKEFDHFMAEYHEDFHKANLSYAYLQAAVMRLEVIAENFRAQSKNHTSKDVSISSSVVAPHRKLRREMQHRILNDKMINIEKAMLTRNADSDGYKHQIIGFARSTTVPEIPTVLVGSSKKSPEEEITSLVNTSNSKSNNTTRPSGNSNLTNLKKSPVSTRLLLSSEEQQKHLPNFPHVFPKLRVAFDCGRSCEAGLNHGDVCTDFYLFSTTATTATTTTMSQGISSSGLLGESNNNGSSSSSCGDWRAVAAQRITSLVRSLDSISAIIQSPIVAQPHE